MHAKSLQSCPTLFDRQAPLFMGFSRQEYWSGLPFHSPGDFPNPGIEPRSSALAGGLFTNSTTREAYYNSAYIRALPKLGVQ